MDQQIGAAGALGEDVELRPQELALAGGLVDEDDGLAPGQRLREVGDGNHARALERRRVIETGDVEDDRAPGAEPVVAIQAAVWIRTPLVLTGIADAGRSTLSFVALLRSGRVSRLSG